MPEQNPQQQPPQADIDKVVGEISQGSEAQTSSDSTKPTFESIGELDAATQKINELSQKLNDPAYLEYLAQKSVPKTAQGVNFNEMSAVEMGNYFTQKINDAVVSIQKTLLTEKNSATADQRKNRVIDEVESYRRSHPDFDKYEPAMIEYVQKYKTALPPELLYKAAQWDEALKRLGKANTRPAEPQDKPSTVPAGATEFKPQSTLEAAQYFAEKELEKQT